MTSEVTALLCFCEGAHDLAFVRRALRHCLGFEKADRPFSALPAPFNSLFKRSVERHAAEDLSLDMAHKFYLPDHILGLHDVLVLLFNAGGNNRAQTVGEFLRDYLPLLRAARTFPEGATAIVTRSQYLFLDDADSHGPDLVRKKLTQDFAWVGDEGAFLVDPWQVRETDSAAAVAGDVASYVWRGDDDLGTLEDILLPIHRDCNPARVSDAEACIDHLFEWETRHSKPERRIAEGACRGKAVITLLGQREKPGGSQSVIIGQTKTMTHEAFGNDGTVKAFVAFVSELLGLEART